MRKKRDCGDGLTTKKIKANHTKKRDEEPLIVRKRKKRSYTKKAK